MSDLYVWGIKTTSDDPLALESLNAEGAEEIARERGRQFIEHRHSIKDDVLHNPNGELIVAARALMKELPTTHDFPDHWGLAYVRKLILKPLTERYIIAAALIAAEVDRRRYIQEVMKNSYPKTPKEAFKKNG